MDELQYSLQQAMADAAGLRETSQKQARQLAQHPTEDEPHALSCAQVRPVDGDAQHLQPYVVEAATVCGGRLQP